jgi:predicted DNA-binding transcriptional regulator AlpA
MTNIKQSEQNNNEALFLTRRGLSRRWAVSEMTIRRREMDGTLPKYSIGRGIRFLISDVEAVEAKARIA